MAEKRESNNNEITFGLFECLRCSHSERVTGKREEYSEVKVCPECMGAFVDVYHIAKYKHQNNARNISSLKVKIDVDCSEALKGLKAVARAAKKATAALNELEQQQKNVAQALNVGINMNGKEIAKVVGEQLEHEQQVRGRF